MELSVGQRTPRLVQVCLIPYSLLKQDLIIWGVGVVGGQVGEIGSDPMSCVQWSLSCRLSPLVDSNSALKDHPALTCSPGALSYSSEYKKKKQASPFWQNPVCHTDKIAGCLAYPLRLGQARPVESQSTGNQGSRLLLGRTCQQLVLRSLLV